jgi:hypothetical protein
MDKTNLIYYCKDCRTKIYWSAALYGKGRCKPCSLLLQKGKNHPMFGKHPSKESRLKMSKSAVGKHCGKNNGRFGKKLSKETRLKISKAKIGYKHSLQARKRISLAGIGRKHSEETKRKLSESRKGKLGSNWLGGLSFFQYSVEFNDSLKQKIRKRDNYCCRVCNKTSKRNLSIHHIDYNKENCKEDNLISLCDSCHLLTNYNRDYWYAYCKYIMDNFINKI